MCFFPLNQTDTIVSADEEDFPVDSDSGQQHVVTGATVPITGSLLKTPESFPCAECEEVFSTKKALSQHRALEHRSADESSASNPEILDTEAEAPETATNGETTADEGQQIKEEAGEAGDSAEQPSLKVKLSLRKKRSRLGTPGNNGRVKCEHCGKETLKQHMARHMLIHTGVKEFQCHLCTAAYYRKDKLKEHMKKHDEGNVAPPPPDKEKKAKPPKEQKLAKPVKCRKCGFTTADKKEMKAHRLTHPADMQHE